MDALPTATALGRVVVRQPARPTPRPRPPGGNGRGRT